MIKNELMHVPPMEKQLEFKSFIMRIDKLKNISGHKKRPPASLAFKTRKEKKATSPKIKQFMPKTSEIAL